MKTISPKQKHRVNKAAMELAASQHMEREIDREDPTEAAIKIAKDYEFGPDMIRLFVTSYNTGQAYSRQRGGSSLTEKLASVPVINSEEVIERIHGSEIDNSKRSKEMENSVRSYKSAGGRDFIREINQGWHEEDIRISLLGQDYHVKYAEETDPGSFDMVPVFIKESDDQTSMGDIYSDLISIKDGLDKADVKLGNEALLLDTILDQDAEAIQKSGVEFGEFCERIGAEFGDSQETHKYLSMVGERLGEEFGGTSYSKSAYFTDFSGPPYDNVSTTINQITKVADMTLEHYRDCCQFIEASNEFVQINNPEGFHTKHVHKMAEEVYENPILGEVGGWFEKDAMLSKCALITDQISAVKKKDEEFGKSLLDAYWHISSISDRDKREEQLAGLSGDIADFWRSSKEEEKKKREEKSKGFTEAIYGSASKELEDQRKSRKNVLDRAMEQMKEVLKQDIDPINIRAEDLLSIFDASHQMQRDLIKAQSVLALFKTDEYLGKLPEREVASLFNDVIRFQPHLLHRPELLRMKMIYRHQHATIPPELEMKLEQLADRSPDEPLAIETSKPKSV